MLIDLHITRWFPGILLIATGLIATGFAQGADLSVAVKTDKGQPLAEAVITAVPVNDIYPEQLVAAARNTIEIMDQINKEFVPFIKPILVGTSVSFPNKDNIRHHVYSFSPAKRFELPLYAGTPAQPVLFDKPGVVALGCNIHDWMIGYIYVSETPWFTQTDSGGNATLSSLAPGQYRVRVWHPDAATPQEDTIKEITIANDNVASSWVLKVKKREIRSRRAPLPGPGGYR